ncbi:uncharacterized protein LOC124914850 [Impatiens glandulifera]|uniref:uncharacterized protein LOC124914850 n=1 Tax=Impatiens glandulifera TaxID=253017 RepID=UPI001FB0B5B7|nr:uncharacterized protein LOC124914850 [Impatiens glandulifera]
MSPAGGGSRGSPDSYEDVVKNRFLGFLIWQAVQASSLFLLFKSSILSPFFSPSILIAFFAFIAFHSSLLLFSVSLFFVSSPQPLSCAYPLELSFGLIRTVFVSGGQPFPPDFRRRARVSLNFILFVAASTFSGFLALPCLTWNCVSRSNWFVLTGDIGFRGLVVGFLYGIHYVYKGLWVLQFPIVQRPPFFSYKMGLPSAFRQALWISIAAYLFSALLALISLSSSRSQVTILKLIADEIKIWVGIFTLSLCWELSHHLHQVLHTKRFVFAPSKGSAAVETNPSEPLLAALEESSPRSLMQFFAYLDVYMVSESNVDMWRRAAFFEETGETYKRVVAICLRPLEHLTAELNEGLEITVVDKTPQLGSQLQSSTTESESNSRLQQAFYNLQVCIWCARTLSTLTARSRKEDRYGVAQLSGSHASVMSTLLSCLIAIETLMGKKQSLENTNYLMGPGNIKWATASTVKRGAGAIAVKRRDGPIYLKAYAVADVLRNSIYSIVSAFHEEMIVAVKGGCLKKEWLASTSSNEELMLQKLHQFLDFRAS